VLRELNGLGHEEIATVLDSSPRAVKQTIFEARSSLGECEEGREMVCADVQRMLSDADGRVLRGRRVRAHLRSCRSCRRFKAALAQRPTDLALLAPPLPAAAGAALLTAVAGGGAATAGAGAAGAGAGAGGTAIAAKVVAIVTATAVAAGGTVAATDASTRPIACKGTGEPHSSLVAPEPLGSEPPRPRQAATSRPGGARQTGTAEA
jgi:predicted anti-sigma-YlaC factor YlaD